MQSTIILLVSLLCASVFYPSATENFFELSDLSTVERQTQNETLQQAIKQCLQQINSSQQSYHNNKIIHTDGENGGTFASGQSLPPFPAFDRTRLTRNEYDAMLSANCVPEFDATDYHKYNAIELYCNLSATATEITGLTETFRHSTRSVWVSMSGGGALSAEVFKPVHKKVIDLSIHSCLTQTTLSKLPSLQLSSLLALDVNRCEGLVIKKRDFAYNKRLRMISFTLSTIASIEKNTFMDLPQLAMLSLEYGIQPPFSQSQIAHLQRFHCDCEYSWLRNWFTENAYILADKKEREIVSVIGLHSDNMKQKDIFYAIDCQSRIHRYTSRIYQSTYSVNAEC